MQQPFSNTACHCELAVQQPFFRKFAVLRQHKGNPFAPIQILTGDIRKVRNTRRGRLLDKRRSFPSKSRIERRFESQVAGRSPVCFLVTFCTMQKVTIRSLCREHRGSANLDSARRNGGFAQTKLNPLRLRRFENFPFGKFGPIRGSTPCVLFRRLWRHFFCCCRNKSGRSAAHSRRPKDAKKEQTPKFVPAPLRLMHKAMSRSCREAGQP